jgi:hypothetical protein
MSSAAQTFCITYLHPRELRLPPVEGDLADAEAPADVQQQEMSAGNHTERAVHHLPVVRRTLAGQGEEEVMRDVRLKDAARVNRSVTVPARITTL